MTCRTACNKFHIHSFLENEESNKRGLRSHLLTFSSIQHSLPHTPGSGKPSSPLPGLFWLGFFPYYSQNCLLVWNQTSPPLWKKPPRRPQQVLLVMTWKNPWLEHQISPEPPWKATSLCQCLFKVKQILYWL